MKHLPLLIALCACGGAATGTGKGKGNGNGNDTVPPVPGEASPVTSPPEPAGEPAAAVLGQRECQKLFEHVFEIAFATQQKALPEEQRPTEADLAIAKDGLRKELFGQCLGAERGAFHYDCAIAATDREAMMACMGAD